jgi:chaperonin GroES
MNEFVQKTASGIFLPSSATSSPLPEATVIAVGPGAPDKEGRVVPTAVKAGDRVLLPGWGGNTIKVGEEVRWFFPPFLFSSRSVDWKC